MADQQFVQASYGPVTLSVQTPAPPPEPPTAKSRPPLLTRAQVIEWLTFLRSFTINMVVIGSVVTVLVVTGRDLLRQPIIIEEIALPKSLTNQGYSGAVAAHRLWDAILDIQNNSGTMKQQTSLLTASRQLDVVEPGSGISLQGLTQMLRELFGLQQTRIAGEVICLDPKCSPRALALRLRVINGQGMEVVSAGPKGSESIDAYFRKSAIMLLEKIDPYVVAAYHYGQPGGREKSVRIARELVRRGHENAPWAANLLANWEHERGNFKEAERWFKVSTELSESVKMQDFAVPWIGWGNLMMSQQNYGAAIEKFKTATRLQPDFALAWYSLGDTQRAIGQHDAAVKSFERATQANDALAYAWMGWGTSLAAMGQHEEAVEKFRRATVEDRNLKAAWIAWGASLSALGQAKEADEKYRFAGQDITGGLLTDIDSGAIREGVEKARTRLRNFLVAIN